MNKTALSVLNTTFGYPEFRSPQDEVIDTLINGDNALVLMPTGGGKSLCYQIPALIRPGCAIVISPLIALTWLLSTYRLSRIKARLSSSLIN